MWVVTKGTLKTWDWKTRDHEIYGGGKHRNGKRGTKSQGWKTLDQIFRGGKGRTSVYGM